MEFNMLCTGKQCPVWNLLDWKVSASVTGQADYSAALFACKETQQCCQHINRANLTSWRYKGSVRTRLADESRMGCTPPLLGLPWDVHWNRRWGTGGSSLSSSQRELCTAQLPGELMDTGHGYPRLKELGEEGQEWGDGHQHRQETAQIPHPLPSTWLEWNNLK